MLVPIRITVRWLLCMIVVLLGVSPSSPQGQPDDGAHCSLTPEQVLGQAFSGTAGAEGETGEAGVTPEGEDIEASGLAADPEWIMENLIYAEPGAEPVAILVIDDFSADGTGDIPASHGWLVWQVLEQLVEQLAPETADLITLRQVDFADDAGYRSDLIRPALEDALDDVRALGISRVVLNMSFVFIPCQSRDLNFDFTDFAEARRSNAGLSLIEHVGGDPEYVRDILSDPRVEYIEETGLTAATPDSPRGSPSLRSRQGGADSSDIPPTPARSVPDFRRQDVSVLRLFNSAALQTDPLRDLLRGIRDLMVVPVASSGNFKQRQPFYPARWPEVISVSANEGDDLRFWLNSNNGDVSVPGAWFLFDDDQYRAGTSFAAPVVSLLIALDLTRDEPVCGSRGSLPALAAGSYDNELLADAVSRFCQP